MKAFVANEIEEYVPNFNQANAVEHDAKSDDSHSLAQSPLGGGRLITRCCLAEFVVNKTVSLKVVSEFNFVSSSCLVNITIR